VPTVQTAQVLPRSALNRVLHRQAKRDLVEVLHVSPRSKPVFRDMQSNM
jgi:hypothetical protein